MVNDSFSVLDFKYISKELKNLLGNKLESVVLFGSYARNTFNERSDIDIFVVVNKKISENKIQKTLNKIDDKIQVLVLTKDEFKEKVISFNHQLITLFYDGKVLYEKNKFYYKMENLFLALNRKKEFTLKVRKRVINIKDLIDSKGFY